jgi:hypothetical protein
MPLLRFRCIHNPRLLIHPLYFLLVKSVSRFDEPLFSERPQVQASSDRLPQAHAEEGSLFSVTAFSQAGGVLVYRCVMVEVELNEEGEYGSGIYGEWRGHTALKRRLLSARAGSLLSAHAGAVVTSAADHLECVVWVVESLVRRL